MSQKDIDELKAKVNQGLSQAQSVVADAEKQVSDGFAALSTEVRKTLSYTLNQLGHAQTVGKETKATAEGQYKQVENVVLSKVRTTVKSTAAWCSEYPYAAYTLAAGGLLLFPAPRTFILRRFFGIFQSQESAFRGATERYATLSETSASLMNSQKAAVEEGQKALAHLLDAQRQATAASAELSSLAAKYETTVDGLEAVQETLRPLNHKDVIKLRTDVAREARDVSTSQKEVTRLIAKLTSATSA